MNLLLFGATGHVGHLVLEEALQQGHKVAAHVHSGTVTIKHPNLTIVSGDLRDSAVVKGLMAGCDAVISTLGHTSFKKSDIQTAATRAVLGAIGPNQRFITLTGSGVPDIHDKVTLGGTLVTTLIRLVPGELYLDGVRHAQLLRESQAKYVIVRSVPMIDGKLTGHYRTGYIPPKLFSVATRRDVADFMLANLTTDQWLGKAPLIISY